jgi:hypothetical protein
VNFPNRFRGGYFVNGVESVVFDPTTSSGFVAGGRPAVLGQNLIVTYGGIAPSGGSNLPPAVNDAINQVVTMGMTAINWPGTATGASGPTGNSGTAFSDAAASCSDRGGMVPSGVCIVR